MAVLTEMATAVESAESPPQGLFVVGSGVDVRRREGSPGEPGDPARQRARRTRARAGPRCGARVGACARDGGVHRRPRLLAGSRRNHGRQAPIRSWRARPRRWRRSTQLAPAMPVPPSVLGRARVFRRGRGRRARGVLRGREPQAVPARRQRADLDLRGWRCRPGDFAGGQHPPDRRPAAEPRRDAGHPEPGRACARAASSSHRPFLRPRPPPSRRHRRPSRRPCRWCSRRPRKRRGRCSSRSPHPPRGAPHPRPQHRRLHPLPAAPLRFPRPRGASVLAPPIYNPPVYNPQPPIYIQPRPPVWVPPWQRPSQKPPWQPPWIRRSRSPTIRPSSRRSIRAPARLVPGSGGYPGFGGSGSVTRARADPVATVGDGRERRLGWRAGGGPSICVLGLCTGGH